MEENKNLWNKTTAELTVKDQLIVAAVAPIVVVGVMVAASAVVTVADKIVKKFRKTKSNLQIVTEEN